jgi:hypothetical protein
MRKFFQYFYFFFGSPIVIVGMASLVLVLTRAHDGSAPDHVAPISSDEVLLKKLEHLVSFQWVYFFALVGATIGFFIVVIVVHRYLLPRRQYRYLFWRGLPALLWVALTVMLACSFMTHTTAELLSANPKLYQLIQTKEGYQLLEPRHTAASMPTLLPEVIPEQDFAQACLAIPEVATRWGLKVLGNRQTKATFIDASRFSGASWVIIVFILLQPLRLPLYVAWRHWRRYRQQRVPKSTIAKVRLTQHPVEF